MPVLIVSENTSPHVGFSRNRSIWPSSRVMTMPKSTGFSTRFNAIVAKASPRVVLLDDPAEVDVGEHVAGDHEERLVELGHRVAHRAGGAERRLLGRVPHADAELRAVAEVGADVVGHERDRHDDVVEAVPREELHDVLHHRHVRDRHHRLGLVARERPQARAFTAGQDHSLHARTSTTGSQPPGLLVARLARDGHVLGGGVVAEARCRRSRIPTRTTTKNACHAPVVASAPRNIGSENISASVPALPAHTTSMRRAPASAERDRGRGDEDLTDEHDPHHDVDRDREALREHRDRGRDQEHPVGGRVEDLAELAALIEVPGDVAVDPVGRAEPGGQQPGGRARCRPPTAARGTAARRPAGPPRSHSGSSRSDSALPGTPPELRRTPAHDQRPATPPSARGSEPAR